MSTPHSDGAWYAGLALDDVDRVLYEPEPDTLAKQHPIPAFDAHITFDEAAHVYTVDGVKYKQSVTSFIKTPFEEFDEEATIKRMLGKPQWGADPSYRYYRKERWTIKGEWARNRTEAAEHGTLMHKCVELFYNAGSLYHREPRLEPFLMPSMDLFRKFHAEHVAGKLEPFRTELRVADRSPHVVGRGGLAAPAYLAGSVDMIFRHANRPADGSLDRHVVVMDWKRSKKVDTEGFQGRMCAPPFERVPDCKLGHFQLQLNTYKYIIERNTDLIVDAMYVCVFHPAHGDYRMFKIEALDDEVRTLFAARIAANIDDEMRALELSTQRLRVCAPLLRAHAERGPFGACAGEKRRRPS